MMTYLEEPLKCDLIELIILNIFWDIYIQKLFLKQIRGGMDYEVMSLWDLSWTVPVSICSKTQLDLIPLDFCSVCPLSSILSSQMLSMFVY